MFWRREGIREFVVRVAKWFKRQGSNVIHRSPYVVATGVNREQDEDIFEHIYCSIRNLFGRVAICT